MKKFTLEKAWEAYSRLVLSGKSRRSQITESGRWENHIKPFFKNKSCSKITNIDALQFVSTLIEKELSPQTIRHCISLVTRILNKSVAWGLYSGNIPKFEVPKFDNKRVRFLSSEEVRILFAELYKKSVLWYDISLFSLTTGMRLGEIINLKNIHINLKLRFVNVFETKNGKSRSIPLNNTAIDILIKYLKFKKFHEYVFVEDGKRPSNYDKVFSRVVEKCQLNKDISDRRQRVVFHTLRHTFASWLVQQGTPLAVVSNLLGHSSIQMTMRYAHLAPENGQYALMQMEKLNNIQYGMVGSL